MAQFNEKVGAASAARTVECSHPKCIEAEE